VKQELLWNVEEELEDGRIVQRCDGVSYNKVSKMKDILKYGFRFSMCYFMTGLGKITNCELG
jgi:hypothetical protein